VTFDLLYDDVCIAGASASEDCFRIDTIFNGQPLAFDECVLSANENGTGCSYTDWKAHMANIWYDGYSADNLD